VPYSLLLAVLSFAPVQAQVRPRGQFSPTTSTTTYPLDRLAAGVFAILGDTARGVEGRPNAGFIITDSGIVVVGGVASPAQGEAVVRTIRSVSTAPIRWLVLYAHHPDMQFGAIALRRAGAKVIAHPDANVLAAEGGPDQMVADWDAVVGLQEMLGFEYANTPDRPVTGTDTLIAGGRTLVLWHPGAAHSAGDVMLWLPEERILFTGDVVVGDAAPMVVDGSSRVMLKTLGAIDRLAPAILVPGHGPVSRQPAALVDATRQYFVALRESMKLAVEEGVPMSRALGVLPPADEARPVSLNSRRRRNANRVYVEMEREVMGLGQDP
jgi:glyoxylase-like metal-dependent hydrolase (beta-lactamase superfamily II)